MINFLAGLLAQIVLFGVFEHKSDAMMIGVILIVVLSLRHFSLIAFVRRKSETTIATNRSIHHRA